MLILYQKGLLFSARLLIEYKVGPESERALVREKQGAVVNSCVCAMLTGKASDGGFRV